MKFLLLFSTFSSFVCAQIAFINPEPSVEGQTDRHYELNPTYVIGSSLLIQWTSPANSVSIVLYQERADDQFEYVFANSVGLTSFRWNVGTQKDLRNGNVFFFQIFVTGETSPAAGSRFFNLTRGSVSDDDDDSSSSTLSSFTTSTLSATPTISLNSVLSTSTSASTTGTTSTAFPTSGPDSAAAREAVSTGSKVGTGVGVPIGILALLLLAFFFWRRRRNRRRAAANYANTVPPTTESKHKSFFFWRRGNRKSAAVDYTNTVPPTIENKYAPPGDGSYAPNAMAEQGGGYYKPAGTPGAPTELSGGTATPGTMRSELANTGTTASVGGPNEMYTSPTGAAVPHAHGGGEVHEMPGVRYT